jgi:hypothetical protein
VEAWVSASADASGAHGLRRGAPSAKLLVMEGSVFDEGTFFAAIASSGARALLLGRRAMAALGLPVLTADYDYWLDPDDIGGFNAAAATVGLLPNHTPDEARSRGRYVLENDEHVDVLCARVVSTVDGVAVVFDEVFGRRQLLDYAPGVTIAAPSLADLILTKKWSSRDRDIADVRLLEALRRPPGSTP